MNSLTPLQQKQLSALPILESMVYVNLAINWAIALGIKDKKVFKHLKKHYHHVLMRERKIDLQVVSGWRLYKFLAYVPHDYIFVGMYTLYDKTWHETRISYFTNRGLKKEFELMRHLTMPDAAHGNRGEVYLLDQHGLAVSKLGTYWFGKKNE